MSPMPTGSTSTSVAILLDVLVVHAITPGKPIIFQPALSRLPP
jgi:hypothetical protein